MFAHGGGGEIYRDHCFIQDFPNYGSRKINLQRYFRLRMMPVSLPADILTPSGRELLAAVQALVLDRFRALAAATNNETYDRIYFLLRAPEHFGQHCANYVNMGLDAVAPLVDYQSALAAIGLAALEPVLLPLAPRGDLRPLPGSRRAADGRRLLGLRRDGGHAARRALLHRDPAAPGRTEAEPAGDRQVQVPQRRGVRGRRAGLQPAPARLAAPRDRPGAPQGRRHPRAARDQRSDLRDIHVGRVLTLGMFLGEVGG